MTLPADEGAIKLLRSVLRRACQNWKNAHLPVDTSLRALDAAIKARWDCEQAHQRLERELGLAHFEGRPGTGLRRHALVTCAAYACLQHLRLARLEQTLTHV